MVNVLTPAIRAGGNDIKEKQVGEALWGAGLADGMKAISEILSTVLSARRRGNEVGRIGYVDELPWDHWMQTALGKMDQPCCILGYELSRVLRRH